MAANNIETLITIPWLPESQILIRPMSIQDERKLLANMNDEYAYDCLVKDCCKVIKGFDFDVDYSATEREYLISKIRTITYGNTLLLGNLKCPHCGFNNKNHKVDLMAIPIHEFKDKIYYTLSDKSNILDKDGNRIEKVRLGYAPCTKTQQIQELMDKESDESVKFGIIGTYIQLAIFLDFSLEEANKLAESGELSLFDIKQALNIVTKTKYGLDLNTSMICHNKECKKEFDFELKILGPGLLVPCFD